MRHWMFPSVLAGIVIVGIAGCSSVSPQGQKAEKAQKAEKKETPAQSVALSQVPEPAQATIKKLIATGKIKKIEKAEEDGKTVYDVEATVQGKDVEYDIAADGTVLTTGQSVPYASLPIAARNTAAKYFGSATGLNAFVEVEDGKTFYEVSGKKGKTPITLKLSDTGQIVEEEKE